MTMNKVKSYPAPDTISHTDPLAPGCYEVGVLAPFILLVRVWDGRSSRTQNDVALLDVVLASYFCRSC